MPHRRGGLEVSSCRATNAKAFGSCNESFLQRFNTVALLQIHKAWCLSDWDFLPDCWTNQQIRDAIINGIPPKWDDQERPVYTHD